MFYRSGPHILFSPPMSPEPCHSFCDGVDLEALRLLLCDLHATVREHLILERARKSNDVLSSVADHTQADTIYYIDKAVEGVICDWFDARWPKEWPVDLVMEGLEDNVKFPRGVESPAVMTCIIDPIDGTRGLMYDKRAAWCLSGIAPGPAESARLEHIAVAAMTELPTTKQWRSDQISAVRGRGLVAVGVDVRDPARPTFPVEMRPSSAKDFRHSFASFAKFFPEGRVMTSQLEETLWDRIVGIGTSPSPVIFDDQYISTGGQIYEIMCGHDRMVGDLRPYSLRAIALDGTLVCHPYDICTEMLAREAGCVVEHPLNGPVCAPMNTVASVCWVAYANETLAGIVRPILAELVGEIKELVPGSSGRRSFGSFGQTF